MLGKAAVMAGAYVHFLKGFNKYCLHLYKQGMPDHIVWRGANRETRVLRLIYTKTGLAEIIKVLWHFGLMSYISVIFGYQRWWYFKLSPGVDKHENAGLAISHSSLISPFILHDNKFVFLLQQLQQLLGLQLGLQQNHMLLRIHSKQKMIMENHKSHNVKLDTLCKCYLRAPRVCISSRFSM